MTTALRRWGPWAVLLVVAAVAVGFGLQSGGGHPSLDARVQHVAGEVRCPVCDGETVAQSQAAPSVAIRAEIRQELQAGETDPQILAGLVRSYGAGILEKPPASGIGAVVWVVPVVAVVAGATALGVVLARWRKRGGAAGAPGAGAAWTPDPEPVLVSVAAADPAHPSVAAATAPSVVTAPAPAVTAAAGEIAFQPPGGPAGEMSPAVEAARPRPRRPRRGVLIGAGAVIVAAGASWAVVAASGNRLPGESITGQALGAEVVTADLQAAENAEARNDALGALQDYQKILDAEPDQVQALTGKGWLLVQTGEPALLAQGLTTLAAAEKADPTYAPAHVYRGLALLGEADYTDSVPELEWYLAHDPDPSLVPQVEAALAKAEQGAAASAGPTPTTTIAGPAG